MGKDIDEAKLTTIAQQALKSWWAQISSQITGLSQEEREILANYLSLVSISKSDPQQYQQQILNLLQQSIGWWSQLIVFKVK
jgi:hypothetical protein